MSHASFSKPNLGFPLSAQSHQLAAWGTMCSPGHNIDHSSSLDGTLSSGQGQHLHTFITTESRKLAVPSHWMPRFQHISFYQQSPSCCPWKEVLVVLLLGRHHVIAGHLSDFTTFYIRNLFTAHAFQRLLNRNIAEAKSTNGVKLIMASFNGTIINNILF